MKAHIIGIASQSYLLRAGNNYFIHDGLTILRLSRTGAVLALVKAGFERTEKMVDMIELPDNAINLPKPFDPSPLPDSIREAIRFYRL